MWLYSNYLSFYMAILSRAVTGNFTLPSVSRLAEHVTHDVIFGGLAVPQAMHSSLSASRTLACGTFCGRSGASHIRQFGAFRGTIPLQLTHGPTYHKLESVTISMSNYLLKTFNNNIVSSAV